MDDFDVLKEAQSRVEDDTLAEKPVIFADPRTDSEKFDPNLHRGALDPSRIPGYSEIVQANDIDKADPLIFREQNLGKTKEDLYRQIGAQPQVLPVEFKWLRISGPGGGDSHNALRELDGYKTKEGFSIVTEDVLKRFGYGFPPAGRRAEDGSIRRGPDVALYMREGEVAQNWEKFYADETARMEGAGMAQTLHAGKYDTETFETVEHETALLTH